MWGRSCGDCLNRCHSQISTSIRRTFHNVHQRLPELYRESEREHHALPKSALGGGGPCSVQQPVVVGADHGDATGTWPPMARQMGLLQQGTTLLGLDVGAYPKAPAFRAWAVCVKCVIADHLFGFLPHHDCNGRVAGDTKFDCVVDFFPAWMDRGLHRISVHMAG